VIRARVAPVVSLSLLGWLLAAGVAIAASPTPTPAAGDPRSAGEGPGLVGEPLLAIGLVVLIGVSAALVTAAWARRTRPRGDGEGRPGA
jgi:hypothetical protein